MFTGYFLRPIHNNNGKMFIPSTPNLKYSKRISMY